MEFVDINMETTVNDYKERGDDSNSDFEDDDKSYKKSDDSTIAGDGNLSKGPDQLEEDQQQHFNVPEVNNIDDESDGGDEGVGENNPVQENEETVHEIEDEAGTGADDESVHKSERVEDPSIESVETVDDEEEQPSKISNKLIHELRPEPEEPPSPRPPAVRKLDSDLDGNHWSDSMVGLVIHEHCIRSVIKEYTNLEATLSTPQYGFQKGMKVFQEQGYKATVKDLDKNLIGRNVINMLPARSITHDMMKMSLAYLMFLKRKRSGLVKARGCAGGRPQREYITKLESSLPCVKTHTLFLSYIVDAFENRCVVVADIPAAFLLANWP